MPEYYIGPREREGIRLEGKMQAWVSKRTSSALWFACLGIFRDSPFLGDAKAGISFQRVTECPQAGKGLGPTLTDEIRNSSRD